DALTGNGLADIDPKYISSPRRCVQEAEEHVHGGRLSCAIGPEKDENLALIYFKIKAFDGLFNRLAHLSTAIIHPQVFKFYNRIQSNRLLLSQPIPYQAKPKESCLTICRGQSIPCSGLESLAAEDSQSL